MRIQILRSEDGDVDGVALDRFLPGLIYDVPPSLATYLVSSGSAAPVWSAAPALVAAQLEHRVAASEQRFRDVAAEWSKSRRQGGEAPATPLDEPPEFQ